MLTKLLIYLFVYPVSLCIEIIAAGFFVDWFTKKHKLGKLLVIVGAVFFLLFSTFPFPNFLLGCLEYKYPPLKDEELQGSKYSDIRYVVVLDGGGWYSKKLPITSNFSPLSLVRITEGIRLYFIGKKENMKLIVSGGDVRPTKGADLMARLAREFGIAENNIIIERDSLDTYDEARLVKDIVKDDQFFLVTSAGHMPRSMALFNKYGMSPVAAPTNHRTRKNVPFEIWWIIPSASNIEKSELAFYEFLGFAKAKLFGHL
ncbi:MAG TPA: ElyC/SanA/YdcF family protein [Candidatus Brocadiaceae bacterium]|nr:ElyC/SanA/YdcF family protein [Candidatus Brocadiaceae bacterium]